jgi:16S rRNA G1207 methylase RsmC
MNFTYKGKKMKIERYPQTSNKSLKPWNAGEELVVSYILEKDLSGKNIAVYNDKFGFLSLVLNENDPIIIIDSKSQEKAIVANLNDNNAKLVEANLVTPLVKLYQDIDYGVIKVPKSTDLFRLYLSQIHRSIKDDGEVICSFMTKNFNKTILKIANDFFEDVQQSLAWKKSRLLILKGKKELGREKLINTVKFNIDKSFQQYFGVFSAKKIDFASQYFINYISLSDSDKRVLDLASGNGVLAYDVSTKCSDCEIHLMDDSVLAIESSKLNLVGENFYFHCNDTLDGFELDYFDLVVSNPPFHFEYENNIEVSLRLFEGVHSVLKLGGRFQLVANIHLNYKTHLNKYFASVDVLGQNDKFIVYECVK